jgi:hypothetical protein
MGASGWAHVVGDRSFRRQLGAARRCGVLSASRAASNVVIAAYLRVHGACVPGAVVIGAGAAVLRLMLCPPCNPHASSLRGSNPRVPMHKHVWLMFPGRGVPGGRARADIEMGISDRWPLRRSCGAHGACRDAPPAPTVVGYIVKVAHEGRGADMLHNYVAGQNWRYHHICMGGCPPSESPCTASVRNHPPSPATCTCSWSRGDFCSRGTSACVHRGRHTTRFKIGFSVRKVSKLVFWGGVSPLGICMHGACAHSPDLPRHTHLLLESW